MPPACKPTGWQRGPTSDSSPFKTFTSCGSSSMFDLRKNAPTSVTRQSFFTVCLVPVLSHLPTYIVRNFRTVNLRPPCPHLSCLKTAGPGSSILMSSMIIKNTGQSSANALALQPHSIAWQNWCWQQVDHSLMKEWELIFYPTERQMRFARQKTEKT